MARNNMMKKINLNFNLMYVIQKIFTPLHALNESKNKDFNNN
jgi:hypothetical protein